ncbi:restriction endonuclease subunit S [Campylobacter upsaliensis]|uniref:Type I restriction modification DNA specificity domain-containing protein n=1 Tax=Campylobacter upsaliensis TaxID=28080 RepID=A0A381EHE3_CAMUP|nr:restriction endonuclease subunit S [Campylobacter upsaliensis]SUX26359.1 type I restriction modification DNA specificity domain-containing protein [Campylobacter upsaliensis]
MRGGGKIPAHWEIRRLKYLFYISKEESRDEFPNVLSLTQNGIIERDITTNKGQLAQNYIGYNIVKRGDIILNPMDLSSGYVAKSTFEGVISQAYIKIRPLETLNLSYYESFFQNLYHYKILWHLGKGISYDHRWTLGNDVFLNIKIPLPPLQEQKEIAEFLDKKCEKIQNYINKKQKLITLLQEKKQALINEAVTKGLNPNIEFKNSGIEYLGGGGSKIPKHWEIKKLKYIGEIFGGVIGKTIKDFSKEYKPNFKPYITFTNVCNNAIINPNSMEYVFIDFDEKQNKVLKNDILFLQSSETFEDVGKSAIYLNDDEVYLNTFCKGFRIEREAYPMYLNYLLSSLSYKRYFMSVCSGFTRINLRQEHFLDIPLILPPLQEQKEIAEFLDSKVAQINSAIEKTKKQIELVREYKNTLINEAVCGRIKLKEVK